jgi:proteasome accessory factor A
MRRHARPHRARQAGERILEELLVDAGRRLGEEGLAGDTYLFKNNAD